MLYFHGDTHGILINSFSYKQHPEMRQLTEEDYLFILGDCGVPWNDYTKEEDIYQLKWLDSRPYKTIIITGNHDNYDMIEQMQPIQFCNGIARQANIYGHKFHNIKYINEPTILNIQDTRILIIPGADSHDIQDGIIDGTDKDWRKLYKAARKNGRYYTRISHITWWPQEKINIDSTKRLLNYITDKNFDLILSHDCPEKQLRHCIRDCQPTDGELFLNEILTSVNYKVWLHGHMHQYVNNYYDNIIGIYHHLFSLEDILNIRQNNLKELQQLKEGLSHYE